MDKNSSLRCLKYSLIAGNSAVVALGLAGFITGLVAPMAMSHLGVSGSQLALVSSIAVVIAVAGLIGALREHFCLLLTYALCILSVFIFRLTWSLTTPLHQSGRFVMDTTVSLTLLSSLAKLFLMIFAILLALAAQNSLPLTKQKFLYLKDKLKNKNKKKSKDKIDGKKIMMMKTSSKQYSSSSKQPSSKSMKNHHHHHNDPNGIYVSNASHNIYESGRRRSPSSRMMINGSSAHHHHHGSSTRSHHSHRRGVGYSGPTQPTNGPTSPNESAHSSASQDSNNNINNHHKQNGKLSTHNDLNTKTNHQQHHRETQSLPRVPAPRKHKQQQHSNSSDYIHYRSPSPPKITSPTPPSKMVNEEIQQSTTTKFTNQPFYNPYRSLPKTSKVPLQTSSTSSKQMDRPISPQKEEKTESTTKSWKPLTMPRTSLFSYGSSTSKPTTTTSISSYPTYSYSTSTTTTTIPSTSYQSSYSSKYTPSYSSKNIGAIASLAMPKTTSATTTARSPSPRVTSPTLSSRLYSSSPSIIPATTTSSYLTSSLFNPKISSMTTSTTTTTNSRTSIFTIPSSSSYHFDGPKLFGSSSSYTPKTTTTATNLHQTRNLFSTYTSPYTSHLSSSTTTATSNSTPVVHEEIAVVVDDERPLSPLPASRSYLPQQRSSSKQTNYSSIKSPTPSPSATRTTNSAFREWSSRTPTPPVSATTTATQTAPKAGTSIVARSYIGSKLFSPLSSSYVGTNTTTTTTTTTSRSSLFTTPSYTPRFTSSYSTWSSSSNSTTTSTITTTSSTISNDKYRFFYSTTTTTTPTTSTTSTTNLFARVYPKTYEEYVKSYRYPESTSPSTTNYNQHRSRIQPMEDSTVVTIDQTSTPHENVFVVTGYNRSGVKSATGPTTTGAIEPLTTATVMKTLTTTTQRETSEQQKKMIFYKQQTLFH